MKFYQTVVSLIFFFMYSTVTFGAEETINLPNKVLRLIDEFRFEKNCYKATGHREIRDKEKGGIAISSSSGRIVFESGTKAFYLSLSDMKKPEGELTPSETCSYIERLLSSRVACLGPDEKLIGSNERGELVYKITKDGNLAILWDLSAPGSIMGTLNVPEKITSFDVSEDRKTIVTCGEGNIRKWEFQEHYKVPKYLKMNSVFPGGKVIVSIVRMHGIRKAEKRISTSIIVNFLILPLI